MANEQYASMGPTSDLPGHMKPLEDGAMCDDHPDRAAVKKITGECDSFGSEYMYFCQECYDEYLEEELLEDCEWCHKLDVECSPIRDIDEGLSGPVYNVCSECRAKYNKRLQDEYERYGD